MPYLDVILAVLRLGIVLKVIIPIITLITIIGVICAKTGMNPIEMFEQIVNFFAGIGEYIKNIF